MSEALEILETIRALGADVIAELKVRPASRVPDDLIQRAAAHADEIRALLAGLKPDTHEPTCWRCGAGSEPPAIEDQIETLIYEHQKRGEVFRLRESEISRLRKLLQPGDLIAVAANVHRITNPTYASVTILRDGKLISIDRRELADG